MKLTIVAATGGIGRHLLDQAVAAGHDVTAVARNPKTLPADVRVITADLAGAEPEVLVPAVEGADAVLSCLGPRRPIADVGIVSRGTQAIVAAMRTAGVRRLMIVSAAPIGTVASPGNPNPPKHDPGDGPFIRYVATPLIKRILRAHYADLAVAEDMLRDSGLDWTSLRPPQLTDKPYTGTFRIAYGQNLRGGVRISRADTAAAMLRVLELPAAINQPVAVAY